MDTTVLFFVFLAVMGPAYFLYAGFMKRVKRPKWSLYWWIDLIWGLTAILLTPTVTLVAGFYGMLAFGSFLFGP